MKIIVKSFGFGNGMIENANYVFDVRCLQNPFWIDELCEKRGCDKEVSDYIFSFDESTKLLEQIKTVLKSIIDMFEKKEKQEIVIAFGCTGGHHRSVAFAECIYAWLCENYENAELVHRDIDKGDPPLNSAFN